MSDQSKSLSDVKAIRKRAREQIEQGMLNTTYGLDRSAVVRLLNEALATELVCTLRYRRHYFMATGMESESVKEEFHQHAQEEQEHADQIAARIVQLGGEPNFNPDGLASRSHAEYVEGSSLADMVREDLIAERIAIESYREMIAYFGEKDPSTRRMLEQILAVEEEHAEDMASLLAGMTGPTQKSEKPSDEQAGKPTRSQ